MVGLGMIEIRLPLPPSISRRFTVSRKTGQIILTADSRSWKTAAQWDVKSQYKGEPLAGRVQVCMTVCPDKGARNRRRDLENMLKLPLDALSGAVYDDDSQIDVLTVTRGEPVDRGAIVLQVTEL